MRVDLVIVSIGIRPSTERLDSSGLALDDGVLVDAYGATSEHHVYANETLTSSRSEGLEFLLSLAHAIQSGIPLGHDVPEMPYCPLVRGATALMRSTGDGFAIDVRGDDPQTAEEIARRAEGLTTPTA